MLSVYVTKQYYFQKGDFNMNGKSMKRGFTLIELLVVIAIIAILAAILFPVFARARENARRTSCSSNTRQISIALKSYIQDYDELFPPSTMPAGAQYVGWADASQSYIKSQQIFQCTSETTDPTTASGGDYTDYFYNQNLSGQNESALTFVSNTIMLGDGTPANAANCATGPGTTPPTGCYAWVSNENGLQTPPNNYSTRHLDGANYAFGDGHAKWLKPTRVTAAAASATNTTFSVS